MQDKLRTMDELRIDDYWINLRFWMNLGFRMNVGFTLQLTVMFILSLDVNWVGEFLRLKLILYVALAHIVIDDFVKILACPAPIVLIPTGQLFHLKVLHSHWMADESQSWITGRDYKLFQVLWFIHATLSDVWRVKYSALIIIKRGERIRNSPEERGSEIK